MQLLSRSCITQQSPKPYAAAFRSDDLKQSGVFRKGDVIRSCIFGYLARQRRTMNRPCPTCPPKYIDGQWVSTCQNITVDAKRLEIPDQISDQTPIVNVGIKHIKERLFFPGDEFKVERATARVIAAKLLRRPILDIASFILTSHFSFLLHFLYKL